MRTTNPYNDYQASAIIADLIKTVRVLELPAVMGNAVGRIDKNHLGIYKKLLGIQNYATRVQMIQTLLSGPEYVNSAKIAGIYGALLQYMAAVNNGRAPGPLPYESGSAQVQGQHTASIQEQQYNQIRTNQITHYSEKQVGIGSASHNKLYKPRSTEKALNFFQSCLQILGIEESASLSEELLKKAYKRAALKAHPDKNGGSEKEFEAVTRAYAYLVEVVKRVSGSASAQANQGPLPSMDSVQEQRRKTAYVHEAPPQQTLNPNNLNMSVFNEIFEQTRMPEPDEDGYGDWMKDAADERATAQMKPKFGKEFNRDVFNKMFEEESRNSSKGQQIITYSDPQEIVPVAGVELGRDRPSDYTAPFNADGIQYTDLKNAYTRENTISNKVANVRVTDRSFESVVTQRKSAPTAYSDAERALMEQAQRQREQAERARQIRAAEEQVRANQYADGLKRRLLIGGNPVSGHNALMDR